MYICFQTDMKSKEKPVDACLLLKTCLSLEVKQIVERQKEQHKELKRKQNKSKIQTTTVQGSRPRKRTIKPILAPRKKRGHGRKLKNKKTN